MTEQSDAQFLADKLDCDVWHDAAAELRRLDQFEKAHQVWIEKTNWVQDVSTSKELGMHRADVLKKRIDDLAALNAELVGVLNAIEVQCENIRKSDWRQWQELASPEEFERWAKSRARQMAIAASEASAKTKEQT